MSVLEGRKRVIIDGVEPEIDRGRFPIKRVVGEKVIVEADVFSDSHDAISSVLLYRKDTETEWNESPMDYLANDRWRGDFQVNELGQYHYTVEAWADHFKSWQQDLTKKTRAGQDVSIDLLVGAELIQKTIPRATSPDAGRLQELAGALRSRQDPSQTIPLALSEEIRGLMAKYPDRECATVYDRELVVVVDREKARFSTWYEMFPRSCGSEPDQHGTFRDVEDRLPYIAGMGFDVLYLPPIHPIGQTHRKGKNNAPTARPEDPGSPWAIGSKEGGHKDVHPQLGTVEDFRRLVTKAAEYDIEIALDLAFQCTPDHPYVEKHPAWFGLRPDGTIQYAENPPKKYEDIYPLNFETEQWQALWQELKDVVLFWIDQGVRIFRVDNPHTKPFHFWEWLITEIKRDYPEAIFLAEAFTRPKVMTHLAKLGFTQSYTYFAWRNTKWELTQYMTELTQTDVCDYFHPSFWPNTPDILTEYLQVGERPAFMARLVLAATLAASYGIYGPAFELCENRPKALGTEEYMGSEKYEIRHWDIKREDSLKSFIARVNRIRRENPALQSDWNVHFHPVDNEELICYSKHTGDLSNIILVIVNLDPHHLHGGWVELPVGLFGLDSQQPYQAHDLLSDARYLWHGERNYVEIDPRVVPAHIFSLRRRVRTERDFDYFM